MLIKARKTVVVAMSGGVDSSVAALLLKERGYSVIGISMHLLGLDTGDSKSAGKSCCSIQDIIDAKRVAVKLGIPHFTMNLESEFKELVIDHFIKEYISGKTPNPCTKCNSFLKFGILMERAKDLGADYLATGHYARIVKNTRGGRFLLKSSNISKDQSYVLYNLNQENLKNIMFPIGNLSKESVKKIAKEAGFESISDKKESMDICFVPDGNRARFIETKSGELGLDANAVGGYFKDGSGKIIGVHNGIHNYTVGQRKGLGVSSSAPLYVVKISAKTNEIFLGNLDDCFKNDAIVEKFNFVNHEFLRKLGDIDLTVKIRYSSPNYKCRVLITTENEKAEKIDDSNGLTLKIQFENPVKFIAPGQSAVLYSGLKVVGGGIIA